MHLSSHDISYVFTRLFKSISTFPKYPVTMTDLSPPGWLNASGVLSEKQWSVTSIWWSVTPVDGTCESSLFSLYLLVPLLSLHTAKQADLYSLLKAASWFPWDCWLPPAVLSQKDSLRLYWSYYEVCVFKVRKLYLFQVSNVFLPIAILLQFYAPT